MSRINPILLLLFFLPFFAQAQENNTYATENRLFHVERSKNKNLVCYDLNINKGVWDIANPVVVYWINREERLGERNDLNMIQKKLAFGYKTISHDKTSATISINACSDRQIRLVKQSVGYRCSVFINKQESQLKKIYVKTKTPDSLTVEYVELHGINAKGEKVMERIGEE